MLRLSYVFRRLLICVGEFCERIGYCPGTACELDNWAGSLSLTAESHRKLDKPTQEAKNRQRYLVKRKGDVQVTPELGIDFFSGPLRTSAIPAFSDRSDGRESSAQSPWRAQRPTWSKAKTSSLCSCLVSLSLHILSAQRYLDLCIRVLTKWFTRQIMNLASRWHLFGKY
jgi:hypothetical protein